MRKLLILALALLLALPVFARADALPEFDFDASAGRITAYNGAGGEVVIPGEIDGTAVCDIDPVGFQNSEAITAIALPEGLDVMNDNLTSQMPNLERVTLPESLRVICRGNFQLCPKLTEVTVPAGVSLVSDNCFSWCEQLRSVTFTGVCPQFSDNSFSVLAEDCVVRVPDDEYDAYRAAIPRDITVEPSGENARIVDFATPADQFAFDPETGTITGFRDRLARMDIPGEIDGVPVKAIGKDAFHPAYHLMYLTVPEGVEVIGEGAFAHTNSILYIGLPDSVREIGDEAFLGAVRGSRFHWPASLETIGSKAFQNCYFTDDIQFAPALKSIGDEAFTWSWPKNLILPEGCEPWIGSKCFENAQLDYIQMDSYGFFEMAPDAFEGSRVDSVDLPWDSGWENRLAWQDWFGAQLEDCTVYINNPPEVTYLGNGDEKYLYTLGEDGYFYLTEYEGSLECPYLSYNIWDDSADERVLVQCRGLGEGAFKGNQSIRRFYVTHANWPWNIGAEAFADSSLEAVDLFHTTETIGEGAFRNCANLTEITLPASLKAIGAGAFDGCENLSRVNILCDPAILPENAFANCAALMADPAGITLAADASDEAVARLSAEMGLPWYAKLLREGEEPLRLAEMPYAPTDPAEFEFDPETGTITGYLGGGADVVVPREIDGVPVTAIGYNAFERCRDYTDTGMITNQIDWVRLRSVVLPETVTTIADSAFEYCQQLETFICYGPLQSTGRGAFRLCRSLDNVIFVNGVKMIDNYCFESAGRIGVFHNPVPLDYLGESAFLNSAVERFVVDAAKIANRPFWNCEALAELHFTERVRETDGAVAHGCPNLGKVCFEGDDMEAFSRDGCISECSDWLKVSVPEGADDAMYDRAQACITWGTHALVAVSRGTCQRQAQALPDIDAILNEYAANPIATPEPVVTPEPIAAQPVGAEGEPFLGAWRAAQIVMGGEAYSAADIGMDTGVTFNADGTARTRSVDGSEEDTAWAVVDGAAVMQDTRLTLTEDGRLMISEGDMQLFFERADGEAPAPEAEPNPTPVPETAPETEPAPAGDDGAFIGVKLNCVAAEASGYALTPEQLGSEYSVTFNADGSLNFVFAGNPLPGLSWRQDGDDRVVSYYGKTLRFAATGAGYTLNYLDAMTLTFE